MKKEIIAPFTGKIITIAAGAIIAGSALGSIESMKMEALIQGFSVPGVFEAVAAVGTIVLAGEVIGYFTTHEE